MGVVKKEVLKVHNRVAVEVGGRAQSESSFRRPTVTGDYLLVEAEGRNIILPGRREQSLCEVHDGQGDGLCLGPCHLERDRAMAES